MLSKKFLLLIFFFDYNLIILKEIVIMGGILNHNTVDFLEKKLVKVLKKIFVGIFPSNYVTRFITFDSMMTKMGAR